MIAEVKKPVFNVELKEPVVYAFTCGGTDYYQFTDTFKTPCLRGLQALTIYEEFRSRTTRELYEKETEAESQLIDEMWAELAGGKGKVDLGKAFTSLNELKKVIKNRKERMALIIEPDLVYKLASVVYFDESENPYRYDMRYNEQKIKKWKADQSLQDFFLSQPLVQLIPYLSELAENLQIYSEVATKVMSLQSEFLSTIISRRASMTGTAPK